MSDTEKASAKRLKVQLMVTIEVDAFTVSGKPVTPTWIQRDTREQLRDNYDWMDNTKITVALVNDKRSAS